MQNPVAYYLLRWRIVLAWVLAATAVALAASLFQPMKYAATARVLVTQPHAVGVDAYTAIKSSERIGQNLAELAMSSSFFSTVTARPGVSASDWPADEADRRKEWRDSLDVFIVAGTGVMQVTGYHADRSKAVALTQAVIDVLGEQGPRLYGDSIRLQVIDQPLGSRFVAKPDILRNIALGMVMGFVIGSAWILGRMRAR